MGAKSTNTTTSAHSQPFLLSDFPPDQRQRGVPGANHFPLTILVELCASNPFPMQFCASKPTSTMQFCASKPAFALQGWASGTNGSDLFTMLQSSFGYLPTSGYVAANGTAVRFPVLVGEFGSALDTAEVRARRDLCM